MAVETIWPLLCVLRNMSQKDAVAQKKTKGLREELEYEKDMRLTLLVLLSL